VHEKRERGGAENLSGRGRKNQEAEADHRSITTKEGKMEKGVDVRNEVRST